MQAMLEAGASAARLDISVGSHSDLQVFLSDRHGHPDYTGWEREAPGKIAGR